jgi:hypothetical protein
MASSLPDRPSLERLRKDARRLQRAAAQRSSPAVDLVQRWHPRPDVALADTDRFRLHDAQLTVARRYGFSGWPALVAYVELAATISRFPGSVQEDGLDAADRFATLACLRYDETDSPERWAAAAALLAAEPTIVDRSICAAAAAMDPDALSRHLAADPASVDRAAGPFQWPPLLYVTYSRVPLDRSADQVSQVVTLLLDAGADPDIGYLWGGLATPFTALTGAFGEGEQGPGRQPRHSHSQLVAKLLLDRGADPNDGQTLYNRMFTPGNDHLELLFQYGLGTVTNGPWFRRLGEALETPAELMGRQVRWAAEHGFAERLALLADHGVDVGGVEVVAWTVPADIDGLVQGRTALHDAAWSGDVDRVRTLLDAGADPGIRDATYGTTPLGWAEHAFQSGTADVLRPVTAPGEPSESL